MPAVQAVIFRAVLPFGRLIAAPTAKSIDPLVGAGLAPARVQAVIFHVALPFGGQRFGRPTDTPSEYPVGRADPCPPL